MFGANFAENQSVKKADIVVIFEGKFCQISIGFGPIGPALLMFFQQRSSFALSTTIRFRNEPMAKPLTSWLVPSFSQHNLRLVVSGSYLHISEIFSKNVFNNLQTNTGLEIKKIFRSPFGDQPEKYSRQMKISSRQFVKCK